MLGRDGNDGVLDPAALADALSNPTTLVFGALAHLWNGATWDRQRKATTFKVVDLAAGTTETTIWTPASGKKFRLMGLQLRIGSTAAKLTFRDGTGGTTILVMDLPANTFLQPMPLGQGILSATADNVLTVTRSASTLLVGTVWGCEE
jgi:hypothetical protein